MKKPELTTTQWKNGKYKYAVIITVEPEDKFTKELVVIDDGSDKFSIAKQDVTKLIDALKQFI